MTIEDSFFKPRLSPSGLRLEDSGGSALCQRLPLTQVQTGSGAATFDLAAALAELGATDLIDGVVGGTVHTTSYVEFDSAQFAVGCKLPFVMNWTAGSLVVIAPNNGGYNNRTTNNSAGDQGNIGMLCSFGSDGVTNTLVPSNATGTEVTWTYSLQSGIFLYGTAELCLSGFAPAAA